MAAGHVIQVVVLHSKDCMKICLGGLSIGRFRGGRLSRFDCINL